MDVTWNEPPAQARGPHDGFATKRTSMKRVISEMQTNPGRWLQWRTPVSRPYLYRLAQTFADGYEIKTVNRDDGKFDVWIRWIG